jgi:predicted metal-dependent peptidase
MLTPHRPPKHPVALMRALVTAGSPATDHQTIGGLLYLGPALAMLSPMEFPSLHTGLSVTRTGALLYRRDWVEQREPGELQYLVAHEALHLVLDHNGRRVALGLVDDEDKALWNRAADLEVNSALAVTPLARATPKTVPPLLPEHFGFPPHQTAERYFRLLRELEDPPPPPEDPQCGQGECGSGAGGVADQPEGVDGPESADADGGQLGLDSFAARLEAMRAQVADQVQAMYANGKHAGTLPGALQQWIGARSRKPVVRWQNVLARLLASGVDKVRGDAESDWARPSRKQGMLGFADGTPLLPRPVQVVPKVSVAIDTSGSMRDPLLRDVLTEVIGLCRAVGSGVRICTFDTRIHQEWTDVDGVAPLESEGLRGRGGTDFKPAIEWARDRKHRPDLLVICTDGYGPCPPVAGWNGQVVWLLVGESIERPAKFGRVVRVNREESDDDE